VFVAIEEHMMSMVLEFPEVLIFDDMSDNATKLSNVKVGVIW